MRFAKWIVVLVSACVAPVWALDWTEFRGPTAQGHSPAQDLPTVWSPDENVAWRVEIPGSGWSSPVLYKGKVYLTSAVPVEGQDKAQSLRTLCLDALSGSIEWNEEIFQQDGKRAGKIHGKNSHASPTPVIAEGKLFVHFGTHGTACLDFDGKILWKNQELIYEPVHGNGGSPVVADGKVFVICDGGDRQFVVALNSDTGKLIWKTERHAEKVPKKFAFCTPLLITHEGREQLICPGPGAVVSYDPASGKELWHVNYGNGYSVIPRPVYGHGLLYICSGYDRPSLLAIRPDGTGDVTETHVAWKLDKGVPHSASLLLVDNELYLVSDNGVASAVDAKTGESLWQQRVGGNFSASPVYADGKIYLQNEEGEAIIIKPGTSFEEIGRNNLKERTLASYAVDQGVLFIRTDKALYRVQNP